MHSFSWSVYCLHRVYCVLYCVAMHIFMFNIYWLGMDILIDCCCCFCFLFVCCCFFFVFFFFFFLFVFIAFTVRVGMGHALN